MFTQRAVSVRVLAAAGVVFFALLTYASSASAAVSWSCRASAVTAQVLGGSVLDPVTAGRDGQPCRQAVTGLPNVGESLSLEDIITARTAYAATDPGGDRPVDSKPTASAGVEGLEISLGTPVLGVGAARSSISATCSGGQPQFTANSEVASISLAGTPIVLDGVVQPITDALTDAIGALVSIRLNEQVDLGGGGRAVRAAHITLLQGDTALADVIIAESRLDLNGAACDPNADGNTPGSNTPPGGPDVCPPGSVFVPTSNLCVIPVPGSQTPTNPAGDVSGPGSVVVGPPYQGPSGGTVITLPEAKKRFPKSPCVKGKGPKYVVFGTKGADHITGTNRRDRILGLGGRDRLDGGRNNDCIDGGGSRDVMTGGQDNDRVYGKGGKDVVNGDSGTDKLFGGKGADSFNAGYGADKVRGGRGNDIINVATAGPKANVRGGKGYDVVRCNPEELRKVHAERILVVRPFKRK